MAAKGTEKVKNVVLVGQGGVGKTMLAAAAGQAPRRRGRGPVGRGPNNLAMVAGGVRHPAGAPAALLARCPICAQCRATTWVW